MDTCRHYYIKILFKIMPNSIAQYFYLHFTRVLYKVEYCFGLSIFYINQVNIYKRPFHFHSCSVLKHKNSTIILQGTVIGIVQTFDAIIRSIGPIVCE